MRIRRGAISCVICASAWLVALASPARAEDLDKIIPGLYGGDGITLATTGHQAHFTGESLSAFDSLGAALASSTGVFSYSSSVNSFTYDPVQAVFLPSIDSLGSLVGERAETIGRGKLNVSSSYSRMRYTRFDGAHMNDITAVLPHTACGSCTPDQLDDTVIVSMDLDLKQDLLAFYGTYGITDRLDVEAIVPLLATQMDVTTHASLGPGADPEHFFDPTTGDSPDSGGHGNKTGLGDVIVRAKYNFMRDKPALPDATFVVRGQFATGDSDNFMGTGNDEFGARFILSKPFGRVTPHANLGYEVSTGGSALDAIYWDAGADARVTEIASIGFDVLGRNVTGQGTGVGDNLLDLAVGGRLNPIDNLVAFAILQFPLNPSSGLRTNMTWTVGLEYSFF